MTSRTLLSALVLALAGAAVLAGARALTPDASPLTTFAIALIVLLVVLLIQERLRAAPDTPSRRDRAHPPQGKPPRHPEGDRETGRIKWFNAAKGYGFIIRDQGGEVFVHYRALRGRHRRDLAEGQRVHFLVVERRKGLQADDVELLDENP